MQIQASYEEGGCHCCSCQSLICFTDSFVQPYHLTNVVIPLSGFSSAAAKTLWLACVCSVCVCTQAV